MGDGGDESRLQGSITLGADMVDDKRENEMREGFVR